MSLVKQEQNTLAAKSFAETAVRYPIGVAARLTGIQVETLRVWERRYSVIGPQVSATGRRLYASADLERLRLIKQLVDSGHPISSVASVPSEKLQELREELELVAPQVLLVIQVLLGLDTQQVMQVQMEATA